MSDDLTIRIEALLDIIQESLLDHAPAPMPEHDPLCRTYSGWPDDRAKGCNCSVARNVEARAAVLRIRKALADGGAAEEERVKRSDIPDKDALMACWPWGLPRNDGGALVSLTAMGYPPKVAMRKLEQLVERGLADYGVSVAYTWRTPEGEDALSDLQGGAAE